MANLQIKGMDDDLYRLLKELATAEDRSVSQQVLHLIRSYVSKGKRVSGVRNPAETLLELSGSWEDGREADAIVQDIRKARKHSEKLASGF